MRYICREIYYFIVGIIYCFISKNLKMDFRAKITPGSFVEGYNKLSHHSFFSGELGFATYIGENSIVIGKIGKYCSIAGNVRFLTQTHPVMGFVSSHPAFYSTKKQSGFTYVNKQKFIEMPTLDNKYSIIVGNDVYIGNGATIIGPVKIGDGAVIAANATVTKDVAPYTIVAGTPARFIKKRFLDDEIDYLCKSKWWDKDQKWIKKNIELFSDIKCFKNKDVTKGIK